MNAKREQFIQRTADQNRAMIQRVRGLSDFDILLLVTALKQSKHVDKGSLLRKIEVPDQESADATKFR